MSIQWINNKMSNLFGVTPLIFLISLISFNSTPRIDVQKLSGEDVFRSVFFGEGELAEAVTELKELSVTNYTKDANRLEQAQEFQDKVVTAIKTKYPKYMPSLKTAILSKDRVKISNSIIEGRNYIQEVIWTVDERVDKQARDKIMRQLKGKISSADLSMDERKDVMDTYAQQVTTNTNKEDAVACVAIVLLVLVALLLVVPLVAEGEDTMSHEAKVDGIAGAV